MGRTVRSVAVVLVLLGGLWPPGVAGFTESKLEQLLRPLQLTDAARSKQWLDRLGAYESGPQRERLLVVTTDGVVVRSLDGDADHVAITVELDEELRREGADLILLHNHPNSSSLSGDDLSQLAKAGVAAVVALGHDGSVYAAARGPHFDTLLCGGERYSDVRAAVHHMLLREVNPGESVADDSFTTHLAALALAKTGRLEYVPHLAPDRRAAFQ